MDPNAPAFVGADGYWHTADDISLQYLGPASAAGGLLHDEHSWLQQPQDATDLTSMFSGLPYLVLLATVAVGL